jgi:cation transporter-like permease
MKGLHLDLGEIILTGVAVVSGFGARLWWQSLSRNLERQGHHLASPDSARGILIVAVMGGIVIGGLVFLASLVLPWRGDRPLQEVALEAVLTGVLATIGVATGHLLASLLLHRGKRQG